MFRFSVRKETGLEEILKILDLKRKLEDKMFYKKKKRKRFNFHIHSITIIMHSIRN